MQELIRIEPRRIEPQGAATAAQDATGVLKDAGLVLGLASSAAEIEAIQRLRYQVFTEDMGAVFSNADNGIEQDRFDPWCQHLMVRELAGERVVGTYRVLTPEGARQAGGYYAESEFDLNGLGAVRENLAECGRSCTHADYRDGSVIMLLWSGVAQLLARGGYRYVLGCASVSLRDGGEAAAQVWRAVANRVQAAMQPGCAHVRPHQPYPVTRLAKLEASASARVPPLIKGYLKLGATVCGEPAWDPAFNAADFPVLLDMQRMDVRYRRHFGLDER